MTDSEQGTTPQPTNNKGQKSKGLLVAAAAFVAIALVGGVAFLVNTTRDDNSPAAESEVTTTTTEAIQLTDASAIRGTTGDIVDGPNDRPSEIEFAEDGTFRVKEFGLTLDTGTYTATGDTVTFLSSPSNDVNWFTNDEFLRMVTNCEDVVGEYRATFDAENLLTLSVVWDDCAPRVAAANGLVMRLTS